MKKTNLLLIILINIFVSCKKNITNLTHSHEASSAAKQSEGVITQGVRTGSGGDGVACYDENGELENVFLWDYIEAEYRNGFILNLGPQSVDEIQVFNLVLNRILSKIKNQKIIDDWKKSADVLIRAYSEERSGKTNTGMISFLNKGVKKNPRVSLKNLKDLRPDIEFTQKNCHMAQVAKQEKKNVPGSPFLIIDDYYFSRMSKKHKAGLLIHEFLLSRINAAGPTQDKTTFPARALNALASSESFQELTREELEQIILNMGIIKDVIVEETVGETFKSFFEGKVLSQNLMNEDLKNGSITYTAYNQFELMFLVTRKPVIYPFGSVETIQNVDVSSVTMRNGKLINFGVNKDTILTIPLIEGGKRLSGESNYRFLEIYLVEENFISRSTEQLGNRCLTHLYGSDDRSFRSTDIACHKNDLTISFNDQELVFAKNGIIGIKPATDDLNYISRGLVYGGQSFKNPDGSIVSIGSEGKCIFVSINFESDGDFKYKYTLEIFKNVDEVECPKLEKIYQN